MRSMYVWRFKKVTKRLGQFTEEKEKEKKTERKGIQSWNRSFRQGTVHPYHKSIRLRF